MGEPYYTDDAVTLPRMTTTPVRITPLSSGGWQIVCDRCDLLTAVWEHAVAEHLRDRHPCHTETDKGQG